MLVQSLQPGRLVKERKHHVKSARLSTTKGHARAGRIRTNELNKTGQQVWQHSALRIPDHQSRSASSADASVALGVSVGAIATAVWAGSGTGRRAV
jgi:uncharacterized membrane protein YoaK (UPF0700 family)